MNRPRIRAPEQPAHARAADGCEEVTMPTLSKFRLARTVSSGSGSDPHFVMISTLLRLGL
jgi:hypothetical protein